MWRALRPPLSFRPKRRNPFTNQCLRLRRPSRPGCPPFCRRGAVATRRSAVADRAGACLLPRPLPFPVGQVPNLSAVPFVIPTEAEEPVLSKVLQRRTEPNGTSTPSALHPALPAGRVAGPPSPPVIPTEAEESVRKEDAFAREGVPSQAVRRSAEGAPWRPEGPPWRIGQERVSCPDRFRSW